MFVRKSILILLLLLVVMRFGYDDSSNTSSSHVSFVVLSTEFLLKLSNKTQKHVALKKNIVEGENILTQDMLNEYGSNTFFEIRYHYKIKGYIKVPANCVLHFKGGSISNGEIDFNNCRIISKNKAFYNIHFSHLRDIDVNIFDIPDDATGLLQDIVNSCTIVDLKNKSFNIKRLIEVDGKTKHDFIISNGTLNALSDYEVFEGEAFSISGSILYLHDLNRGEIKNLVINGNRYAQKGIFLYQCNGVVIDNCTIIDFDGKDKNMSWGIRCGNCSSITLVNSHINNILALPKGKNGSFIGSAAGVIYEYTDNSSIINNIIENVQSIRDGDAIHILRIPSISGKPEPTRDDLYEDVNVNISQNIIKANTDSKRCIKIQANGVRITDNYIQKLFTNKTNAINILASNILIENNFIDTDEQYSICIGTAYLNFLHDIVIKNNTINHNTSRDWGACIYLVCSSLEKISIDSNMVIIRNDRNAFSDLRGGAREFMISNNTVSGGSHFFRIKNEINKAEISGLYLTGNQCNDNVDFLCIEKDKKANTKYKRIVVENNTFTGSDNSAKMMSISDTQVVKDSILFNNNSTNKIIGI